jgi:hypothetical protein
MACGYGGASLWLQKAIVCLPTDDCELPSAIPSDLFGFQSMRDGIGIHPVQSAICNLQSAIALA